MKIKVDEIDYEVEFHLPDKLQNDITVRMTLDTWADLIKKEKLKELREVRRNKIKEINKHVDS